MRDLENGVVHGCEGAAAGTGASDPLATSAVLVEDGALGNDDDVSTTQLFLQLSNELALNLVVFLQLAERYKHDDSLAASGDINLLGSSDVQTSKLLLDLKSTNLMLTRVSETETIARTKKLKYSTPTPHSYVKKSQKMICMSETE